jgi:hypothetical protein
MTPQEKLTKAQEIWKQSVAKQRESEQIILKLLRHPDATPEQLIDCHRLTQSVEGMMLDLTTALRKAYPPQQSVWHLGKPWNGSEWDKYHRRDKHEPKTQTEQTNH